MLKTLAIIAVVVVAECGHSSRHTITLRRMAMVRAVRALVLALAISLTAASAAPLVAHAQGSQPPGLPPGVYAGEADYKQAPAGSYAIDPDHAAVVARVSHLRYSW